jgi:hypothetical protein
MISHTDITPDSVQEHIASIITLCQSTLKCHNFEGWTFPNSKPGGGKRFSLINTSPNRPWVLPPVKWVTEFFHGG